MKNGFAIFFSVVLDGILFILTGNDDIHKSLDEFEIRPDRLRAANSVVHGRIWPNFKLIQALMYVIITCKYEKDPIKNNREKSGKTVFQIITLSVAMETSGRIWPNFELIQAFMHVLVACKYEKDQMKNSVENVRTTFSPL